MKAQLEYDPHYDMWYVWWRKHWWRDKHIIGASSSSREEAIRKAKRWLAGDRPRERVSETVNL